MDTSGPLVTRLVATPRMTSPADPMTRLAGVPLPWKSIRRLVEIARVPCITRVPLSGRAPIALLSVAESPELREQGSASNQCDSQR